MQTGDWYDAKLVEDTIEQLNETAGLFGYAFADVRPTSSATAKTLTMDVKFLIAEAPRVYVERIDVNGNTLTQDKVIRREFRLAEGDAFNSLQVKRSTRRIKSLGYFQENFEIEQTHGSAPDRIILEANVEEQATGELSLSAGFSSLEQLHLPGLDPAAQLPRPRPERARRRSTIRPTRSRSSSASPSPICSTATSRSASTSTAATTTASTSSATTAPRPTSRRRPASSSAPACR